MGKVIFQPDALTGVGNAYSFSLTVYFTRLTVSSLAASSYVVSSDRIVLVPCDS
jgi:hypothetical protein